MILTPTARVTMGLGFTQIVGWGTTYLMPSVLGRQLQTDLGLSPELVFAGITVMFAVSAVCSPRVGKVVDRIGARSLMAAGSLVYALSLAAQTPRSVISAVTSRAGVTSKAGLAAGLPSGSRSMVTTSPVSVRPLNRDTSWAWRSSIGMEPPSSIVQSMLG